MARDGNDFAACDVILTTYGMPRRDILFLKDLEFDYVILDEAQAVKNADLNPRRQYAFCVDDIVWG